MIITAYILFAMLFLRFMVMLVNFLSKPYLSSAEPIRNGDKISVLIPARNEENNIGNLLEDLSKMQYNPIEIIICNDHSTDGTEEIIKEYQKKINHLKYFNNDPLPEGWIGKNFACHQLSVKANGKYLLFLDADVRIRPGFIKSSIAYLQKSGRKLLSMFPEQLIETEGEKKTVPLMTWILLTFLPLILVRWRFFSSLSAANGQMMLFETESYREHNWHYKNKAVNVEDIVIARNMKRKKIPISVLLGKKDILCRMYRNYEDGINGFSLNIHQYFNGSRFWMVFFWIIIIFRMPFFIVSGQWILLGISIIFLAVMRIIHANMSQISLKDSFQFYPNQLWALTRIILKNLRNSSSGKIEWKGRTYVAKS